MNNNIKRLSLNLITSIIGTVVGLGVAFLLTPYLVRTIGKDIYSFFPMANNFISYFTIIVTALNALASRFITVNLVSGKAEIAKEYFSSVFFANLFLAAIFIVPMTIIVVCIDSLLHIPEYAVRQIQILFSLVFASFILNLITSVFGAAVFVRDRIDLKSYQHILVYVIRVLGYFILFAVFQPNIVFVGIVTLSESIVNAVMSLSFTKKLLPDFRIHFQDVRFSAIKTLISSGIWNTINSLGSNLLSGMMIILSNILIDANASGNIAMAMTVSHLCITLITMVVSVFYPRMTREFAMNGIKGLLKQTLLSQYILSFITSTPVVVIMVLSYEFYTLWVPGEDAVVLQKISSICLVPFLIQACMWTLTQVFPVVNKLKMPAIATLCFGVVTFLVTLIANQIYSSAIMIPLISSFMNIFYCVVFVPLYVSKLLQVNVSRFLKPLFLGLFVNIFTFAICSLIRPFFIVDDSFSFAFTACVFCLIGFTLSGVICLFPVLNIIHERS